MSKLIKYSEKNIGKVKLVKDFLPSPEELAVKSVNTKITISLSTESIEFFKSGAKKHNTQYQKMIRQLLDEYVRRHKSSYFN